MRHYFKKISYLLLSGLALALTAASAQAAQICVASEITDNGTDISDCDSDCANSSDCSILDAVAKANADADAGEDEIIFDGSVGTFFLDAQIDDITDDLIITGPGANVVTIDGGGNSGRIFVVDSGSGIEVTISGLGLTGSSHGAIAVLSADDSLTVDNCNISNNSAAEEGGGIKNASGNLIVNNSILSGNHSGDDGGAIKNGISGFVTITGTIISGNDADDSGGGISNESSAIMII